MLVLTRKRGQTLKIGDDVIVRVVAVDGKQVKIGIDAPGSVRIMRGELEPIEPTDNEPAAA